MSISYGSVSDLPTSTAADIFPYIKESVHNFFSITFLKSFLHYREVGEGGRNPPNWDLGCGVSLMNPRSCLPFFHGASEHKHFPLLTRASHPCVSGHRGLPSPSGQACPRPAPRFLPFYTAFSRSCLCIMLFPTFPATSLGHIPKRAISGPKGKSLCKGCLWHRFQVSTLFFLKPFSVLS